MHDHSSTSANKRPLAIVFGLTALYLMAEVVGGILTKSLALLADAGHMLTDVVGLGLALFAIRVAERPPTPERTYGYYRVEILAALSNAVVLIGVSLFILYEAYERLRNPPEVATGAMLVVAVIGLCVNLVGIRLLQGGASSSLNVKGAYFEVLSDLLTSVGVIAAAVIMWLTHWYYADPLISAGIGLFILPRTWKLLREAIGVLLEGTPPGVDLNDVRAKLGAQEGVDGVHDLHVWTLTSGMHAMSVHVVLAGDGIHDDVLARVRRLAATELGMAHVTVQVERKGCAEDETHL